MFAYCYRHSEHVAVSMLQWEEQSLDSEAPRLNPCISTY